MTIFGACSGSQRRHCRLRRGPHKSTIRIEPVVARCAVRVHAEQIVVVGSVNVDTVLKLDRLPREGETLAAHGIEQFPGGKVCLSGVVFC